MSFGDSFGERVSGAAFRNASLAAFAGENSAPRSLEIEAEVIALEVIALFDQFRNPLLRYALSFGLSSHDAEEVTQEVFLSLFRHLQLRRSRKNLRGWIFRVTHNLALKQRYENQKLSERLDGGELLLEQEPDQRPNPEQHLSAAQKRNHLLAVVDALPLTDQSCLRLRAEGLRYREIAEVLGISLGSVSISLTRTLARLARAEGR